MLTILNVAYPFAEVSSDAVGGAEQILAALDSALVDAGQRSLVIAKSGSRVRGALLAVDVPEGLVGEELTIVVARAWRSRIERALREHAVDVVHFHGVDCAAYLPVQLPATLVTLHLSVDHYPRWLLGNSALTFNCVSHAQAAIAAEQRLPTRVIANGVDLSRFRPEESPESYCVSLGRICPEKGYSEALRAARAVDSEYLLAGQVFPYAAHVNYFAEELCPLFDGRRRFVGSVGGQAKQALLARARALLVPSRIAETSSLVVMEALACGTPAIVSDCGTLPTLIEPGVTGWVARGADELASAIERSGELDRRACRAQACARFDQRRMQREYLELYRSLANQNSPARISA